MTITNGYCDLPTLKRRLWDSNPDLQADSTDDVALENIIEAASRWIDRDRNRVFYATTATRYFTAVNSGRVKIDDLLSLTSLKTDFFDDGTYETTWTTADYRLFPANAAPYTEINTRAGGTKEFPLSDDAVEVTGSWGYSSTAPEAITEACILISMRVWSRKDLLFGVSGSAELGTQQAISTIARDGEILMLLNTIPKRVV